MGQPCPGFSVETPEGKKRDFTIRADNNIPPPLAVCMCVCLCVRQRDSQVNSRFKFTDSFSVKQCHFPGYPLSYCHRHGDPFVVSSDFAGNLFANIAGRLLLAPAGKSSGHFFSCNNSI